ncbi:MAG: phytoene desaturase family protein [Nitrososphaerota archaeon]|nr:phytoene desaturase family protein [Candidatus Calditenuaceae archaeon]MDW8073477.1 phytoene desaturase family protein [Nitrososphaerota archaeon]
MRPTEPASIGSSLEDTNSRGDGFRVVVVGAGVGGLAVAALLAKDGHEVTVVEKNESIGGRAGAFIRDGFAFDTGPTWYLMPDVFDRFFQEFGRRTSDLYTLYRLDPSYRVFFDDGEVVDISHDVEKVYQLFDSLEEGGGEKLRRFLNKCEELYKSIRKTLYLDLDSPLSLLNREILSQGLKINIFESVESYVKKSFQSDKARKILLYSVGFIGTPPAKSPSFYAILNYVKIVQGVYFPEGGIRRLVQVLYDLAKSQGVEFLTGQEVKKIEVEDGVARRVLVDGSALDADVVVVNADYAYTELNLLDRRYRTYDENYWRSRTLTPSALIAFIGLDRKIDSLTTHNVFLERDWSENFYQIFDPLRAKWPDYASYYVHVPSKVDKSAAPKEGEAVFFLIPIASGLEDSDEKREKLFTNILRDLEHKTGEKIGENIVLKGLFSIRDFSARFNAFRGTALGLAHTLRQTAFWRPRHRSAKVKNLYYTGQYTHPGIGLPMVLISAQIVRKKIAKELKS